MPFVLQRRERCGTEPCLFWHWVWLFCQGQKGEWRLIEDIAILPNDHPAIQYAEQAPDDPVARLAKRVASGEVTLQYDAHWGYLPALLKQFGLNIDSQILVFSKTSF
jgi:hypothetical protein